MWTSLVHLHLPLRSREVVWKVKRGPMMFTPWRKGSWQTLALEWLGHGTTRLFGTAAAHPCCGPLHFPPEHARTRKGSSSAEAWQCGEAHRHVLRSVLYLLMVTGGEALPL